jgi:hypothetical protein
VTRRGRLAAALAVLCALWLSATSAAADPLRILVVASHSRGGDGELPLRHSTEDADQVRDVLAALGGFASDATFRLVDPNAAALRDALDRARALAATRDPAEVTFVLYFSGHGDRDNLRLGGESIPMTEISERVQAIHAALRILVTDACRTDPTRPKGITAGPAFALANASTPASGVVWLYASDTGEAAQESDELRGALFTHYWVSGLRGAADADGDGRVTLVESYDFAFSQTLYRSARSGGILQHPTATFALQQAAPLVLTVTFGPNTKIELPEEMDAHYLVYGVGSRRVIGEIWSNPDHRAVLAIPPGQYIVQRRSSRGASAAAEIAVASGEARVLSASDFRAVTEEQLAGKGGSVVLRPNEVGLDIGGGASRITDASAALRLYYARSFGSWALSGGIRASAGTQRTPSNDARVTSAGVEALAEWRQPVGALVAAFGAGGAVDVVVQHVQRADGAVASPGLSTAFDSTGLVAGPIGVLRLRAPLGVAAWIDIAVRGELLVADLNGAPGLLWTAFGELGGGVRF